MAKSVGKALYIFLCSILGILLFAIFHRALMVIYYMLLESNYKLFSFGLTEPQLMVLDFFSTIIMVFFGGWYGTALGLHWYRMVYAGENAPGLFHAFVPHHWRKPKSKRITQSAAMPLSDKAKGGDVLHNVSAPRVSSNGKRVVNISPSSRPRQIDSFESHRHAGPMRPSYFNASPSVSLAKSVSEEIKDLPNRKEDKSSKPTTIVKSSGKKDSPKRAAGKPVNKSANQKTRSVRKTRVRKSVANITQPA